MLFLYLMFRPLPVFDCDCDFDYDLPRTGCRLVPAPAWAPPGSLLPGRLSPTPRPLGLFRWKFMSLSCGMTPRPRLAGGNLLAALGYGAGAVCR